MTQGPAATRRATTIEKAPTRSARAPHRTGGNAWPSRWRHAEASQYILPGLALLLAGVPLALSISWIHGLWPDAPEKAVTVICVAFAIVAVLPTALYAVVTRGATRPEIVAKIALATVVTLVVGVTLFTLGSEAVFPADFLVWSESDFVNDILKWRIGYPLYSAEVNNESFFYPPGAQLLTYFIAAIMGQASSLAAYRFIQIGYVMVAAIIAADGVRLLLRLASGESAASTDNRIKLMAVPVMFLAGTNWLTNAYVQNLHNDALAQLICVAAFWLVLQYANTRDPRVLAAMAMIPSIGFLVKQNLVIWLPLYLLFLAIFDAKRSFRRIALFAIAAAAMVAAVAGAGYLLWGESFGYWWFYALSRHEISPLRSGQHVLAAWAYFAAGIAGVLALIGKENERRVFGLFLIWLLLLASEAYTSGAAWMLNHMGPGSMLAVIWVFAAASVYWSGRGEWSTGRSHTDYARAALVTGLGVLLLVGLSTVRIPIAPIPRDAYRYVAEIEREFNQEKADRVLLDIGTWVYVRDGVIMRDRAPSIGERGYSQSGDFSGFTDRIRRQHYAKILMREPAAPDSWYDHEAWSASSGIREALREHYREVHTIAAVRGDLGRATNRYSFRAISVLVPNRTQPE